MTKAKAKTKKCLRGHPMFGDMDTNPNLTMHRTVYGWRKECMACRRLRSRRRYWLSKGCKLTDAELERETGLDYGG